MIWETPKVHALVDAKLRLESPADLLHLLSLPTKPHYKRLVLWVLLPSFIMPSKILSSAH